MKKLLVFLFALASILEAYGQGNPTIVQGTNGIVNVPAGRRTGVVGIGPDQNYINITNRSLVGEWYIPTLNSDYIFTDYLVATYYTNFNSIITNVHFRADVDFGGNKGTNAAVGTALDHFSTVGQNNVSNLWAIATASANGTNVANTVVANLTNNPAIFNGALTVTGLATFTNIPMATLLTAPVNISQMNSSNALYLPLAGGTMSGAINMNGFSITNSPGGTGPLTLVNYQQLTNAVANGAPLGVAYLASNQTFTASQAISLTNAVPSNAAFTNAPLVFRNVTSNYVNNPSLGFETYNAASVQCPWVIFGDSSGGISFRDWNNDEVLVLQEAYVFYGGRVRISALDVWRDRLDMGGQNITNANKGMFDNIYYGCSSTNSGSNLTNVVDIGGSAYQTITLTNNITLAVSNAVAGRGITLRFIGGGTQLTNNIIMPPWTRLAGSLTNSVLSNKVAVCSVTYFDSNDTNAICSWVNGQ